MGYFADVFWGAVADGFEVSAYCYAVGWMFGKVKTALIK